MTADPNIPTPEEARAELVATLNAIEDKLNVPKQVQKATDKLTAKVLTVKEEQPAVFIAGVVGIAAIAGLAVWGIVRSFTR
ncbi:DUF3618 domain-containing protein [Plantibacter sp. Mn2098]|uniref:DUF3618 domain-containing protein n=1 Tax=Plantibacter sp. Mn2098 TaxID=3395266 RepID=UPI003BC1F295